MTTKFMWRSAGLLALVSACTAIPDADRADARDGVAEPADGVAEDPGDGEVCEGPLAVQPVILNCDTDAGYEIDSWRADVVEGPALHLAAIYETHSDHGFGVHPPGDAVVDWKLAGDNVLALSSYEPVNWKINLAPGAALQKVVVFGYHVQTVDAPPGVVVETHYFEDGQQSPLWACGYSLPDDGQGCETDQLIANAEAVTGLALASFDGCYHASQFEFAGCGAPPPDPDECGPALADPPAIVDCNTEAGYEVDSFRADAIAPGPVLHIGSVYETHGNHGGGVHPPGAATVDWELPGENVLGLASYEPVVWDINVQDGAALQKVVVFGYHEQVVNAPPGVEVEIYSLDGGLGAPPEFCGYEFPVVDAFSGCDTDALIAGFEQVTGLKMASFDGCYQATQFHFAGDECRPEECVPEVDDDVILDCDVASGYEVNSWRADAVDGPAVHLLGIYDVDSHNPGHVTEQAAVVFDLPGDNILALSAYEPTEWRVTLGPDAALSKIVVFGYHEQSVVQLGDIPVETYFYEGGQQSPLSSCGYSLPYNGGGCDTDELIANVAAVTGHPVTAFDGCYDAGQFHIGPADHACEPEREPDPYPPM